MKSHLPIPAPRGHSIRCFAVPCLVLFLLVSTLFGVTPLSAQYAAQGTTALDTIRIMNYNVLNYPGSTASIRNPYFRAVVHSAKPDLLFTLEMTSQAGATQFLSSVMNYYQAGLYSTIPFHDGPDTDPHVYYKASKVTFLDTFFFPMSDGIRNIGRYKFRINSSGDTIYVYAVHLKASSGSSNEAQRLAEATALRDTLNKLPAGTKFMVLGDYNLYTSTEGAYVKLLESQADNDGRLKDPINRPGSWSGNASFKDIHTQSPRTRQFDGGANGGMDDRFDFILTSYTSLDNNTIVSSYKAYGNDANHLNDSINRLPNTAVPDSVANGLHYSSDHLPVICDFKFGTASGLGAFAQSSPTNGATNRPLSGTLSWGSSAGATGYDVYLGATNPPTTKVSANQAGTSYAYAGLATSTTYYWKIVARGATDTLVATGAPWSFSTLPPAPAAFSQSSPSNAATGQATSGTLSWGSSTNATGYDVYLSASNPPSTKVSSNQAGTSYAYSGLSNSAVYYWKVVARNAADTTVATGAPWSFTTIVAAPSAFTLTAPSNAATNQATSGTLSWASASGATSYDVYLDTLAAPATVVSASQAGTSYSYGGLQNARTYYWKVVAKNAGGSTAATGAPWAFTTVVAPPGSFSLLAPADGEVDQPLAGTLSWEASPRAAGYDVYLDTNAVPTTLVSAGQTGTTYAYSGLITGAQYHWKVVASNQGGATTANSAPWTFRAVDQNTILASAGPGGAIVPSGAIHVTPGGDQAFIFAPSPGHEVDSVVVDGVRVDSTAQYTFTGVNQTHTIHVVFRPVRYALTVNATHGAVVRQPDLALYDSNAVVELTAVPARGYLFSGWSGDAGGSDNPLSVTITAPKTITAHFTIKQYTLTLSAVHGTVSAVPAQALYDSNSVVTLTATPDSGYIFVGWTGDATGSANPLDVTMSGELSVGAIFATAATTVDVPFPKGWNLVSLPVGAPVPTRGSLFPAAESPLYLFSDGYQARETLAVGTGYWLKLPAADTAHLTGAPLFEASIAVSLGWNIVGSISASVPVNSITSEPPGLVTSSFFAYDGSYRTVDAVEPGKGCWVKVAGPGVLHLAATPAAPGAAIRVTPSGELPPAPPAHAPRALVPADYVLDPAYPSPFNPSTTIRYRLPAASRVRVTMYNLLGEAVAVLADEVEEAGDHAVVWDASAMPSGVYAYRLEAASLAVPGKGVMLTGKVVLIR